MNEDIEKIFNRKIIIDNKTIPIEYITYSGKKESFVVYMNTGNIPVFSYDDEIKYSEKEIEFHIYSKSNYLKIVEYIKQKLKENDYLWNGDNADIFEPDTKYHHFVMTFKKINHM